MATEKVFPKLTGKDRKQLLELLAFIATSTLTHESHRAVVQFELAKAIQKFGPGYIEIKTEPNPAGNVEVFATSLGVAASGVQAGTPAPVVQAPVQAVVPVPQAAAPAVTSAIVLGGGLTPPAAKRGGLKGSVYPFATMAVAPAPNSNFFMPITDKMPDPKKTMASVVSSANKRFAATYPATRGKLGTPHPKANQPTGKDGRRFVARPGTRQLPGGIVEEGVYVYRIA